MTRRFRRGFTLLEVVIAMAILVLSLTTLVGHEGIAIQMSDYSNRMSQATLLAQSKMHDVSHQLITDAMDILDNCDSGDFRDLGFRRFKWEACGYKLEITDAGKEQLLEQIMSGMAGMGMDPSLMGAPGQAAGGGDNSANMMGNMNMQLQMIAGFVPQLLEQIEPKLRKVRVEVKWGDNTGDRSVTIERFVTSLGVETADETKLKDGEAGVEADIEDKINQAKLEQGENALKRLGK